MDRPANFAYGSLYSEFPTSKLHFSVSNNLLILYNANRCWPVWYPTISFIGPWTRRCPRWVTVQPLVLASYQFTVIRKIISLLKAPTLTAWSAYPVTFKYLVNPSHEKYCRLLYVEIYLFRTWQFSVEADDWPKLSSCEGRRSQVPGSRIWRIPRDRRQTINNTNSLHTQNAFYRYSFNMQRTSVILYRKHRLRQWLTAAALQAPSDFSFLIWAKLQPIFWHPRNSFNSLHTNRTPNSFRQ